MQITRSLAELGSYISPSVITIGNFDGVHCGHRMVIASVLERARALNASSVAVTFDPHPAHVLHTGSRLPLITPLDEKLRLLAATGLDRVLVLPFTDELRHWTARHFAERVLRDALHAIEVHEGETFRFGYQAEADIAGLSELGRELNFGVRAYVPCIARGAAISSSRIRTLIAAGRMNEARVLLGRPFPYPARQRRAAATARATQSLQLTWHLTRSCCPRTASTSRPWRSGPNASSVASRTWVIGRRLVRTPLPWRRISSTLSLWRWMS